MLGTSRQLTAAAITTAALVTANSCLAASAATDPSDTLAVWGSEETVVDRQLIYGAAPELVMTTDDRAATGWINGRTATGPGYYVATRMRGAAWSEPYRISPFYTTADLFAHGRSITVASVVALPGVEPDTYGGAQIALQTMGPSGVWGAVRTPISFGPDEPRPENVRGGGSTNGALALTWRMDGITFGSVRPVGGEWTTPTALGEANASTLWKTDPVWVTDDGRSVVALHSETTDVTGAVIVAEATPDGRWTTEQVVPDAPLRQSLRYRGWAMSVNAAGDMVVAWTAPTSDPQQTRVLMRYRPAGQPWGPVEFVSRGEGVDADLAAGGRADLAWLHVVNGRDRYFLAQRSASGSWSTPKSLARPRVSELPSEQASVVVDVAANGDTAVAVDGRGTDDHHVTRCPSGSSCGRPFTVEVPLGEDHMMFESTSNGGGLLVWDRGGGTEEFVPQSIRSRTMRPL